MDLASPLRPWWRRWFGTRSERAAARFLKRKGHRILCRNWSCEFGELDLVTRDGNTLVFVEVRSTAQEETERPAASVDTEKQRRLTRLAQAFLQRYRLGEVACRFDVLAISWPTAKKEPQIDHFTQAFEATE
jgi:putative endonuclease